VPEPYELGSQPKDASEDTPNDYTINVEVWQHGLWLSVQSSAEKTGFHPSQRTETCSRNRKRIMRSGITNLNENERRKHDEDRKHNIPVRPTV
jgi:hypothetical protein